MKHGNTAESGHEGEGGCTKKQRHEDVGLCGKQVREWKEACINANDNVKENNTRANKELREIKKEKEKIEKDLARKEKALAETAALLVLRKKANAILGTDEEEE